MSYPGEYTPASRPSGPVSKKRLKALQKGGKRAQQIKNKADDYHANWDAPNAEEALENALENWPTAEQKNNITEQIITKAEQNPDDGLPATTWWQKFADKIFGNNR